MSQLLRHCEARSNLQPKYEIAFPDKNRYRNDVLPNLNPN